MGNQLLPFEIPSTEGQKHLTKHFLKIITLSVANFTFLESDVFGKIPLLWD
jgi:hypothetical protein